MPQLLFRIIGNKPQEQVIIQPSFIFGKLIEIGKTNTIFTKREQK
jgi:hypothetical protein